MKKIIVAILFLFILFSIISCINVNNKIERIVPEKNVIIETLENNHFFWNGPEEEWNKTFGGTSYDCGNSVYQTADGGYITTGCTESYGAGGSDVWLIKTDPNGTKEWDKTFGGSNSDSAECVQQTSDGGYIITGITSSYGDILGDAWIIKTNTDGNKVWDKKFGGSKYDSAEWVQQTMDGGYIITGQTGSYGAGNSDAWLIKTNPYGNEEWNKTYGGSHYDYSWSVNQTIDSGYILAGRTESSGAGHGDFWLIKTDSNGNKIWDKTFGTNNYESAECVQQTSDGGYIGAGFTNSYGAGWYDFWLIKTDSNGNKEWDKTYGGTSDDICRSVNQTKDEGYILTGGTYSYGAGNSDVLVIKTDSYGNEEWNKTFGESNYDSAECVQQTIDSGYILAGRTESFGAGGSDVWLIRIETENNPPYEPCDPIPDNNSIDVDIETNISWTGGDPDNDTVTYDIYFGTNIPPPKIISNQTETFYEPGVMNYNTTYYWQIVAWDNYSMYTQGPLWKFTVRLNQPPKPPIINGSTNGKPGIEYIFNIQTTDPEDQEVYYYVDWGDSTNSGWVGPYASGTEVVINHTWSKTGTYTVKAKAKDTIGAESGWGTLKIKIPRTKSQALSRIILIGKISYLEKNEDGDFRFLPVKLLEATKIVGQQRTIKILDETYGEYPCCGYIQREYYRGIVTKNFIAILWIF